MKNKLTIAAISLFAVTTLISTITASAVDNGSWVNIDPLHESGHYMTLKESVLHNLPPAIIEGIVFALLMVGAVLLYRYVKDIIKETQEQD